MSKLQLNDDGTIVFQVGERTISLPEPTFGQMNTIMDRALAADTVLPQLATLDRSAGKVTATAEQLEAFNESIKARTAVMFGPDSPHAAVLVDVVKLLTGEEVAVADLPSWAGAPRALNEMLTRWQSPLPGRDFDEM